jgi:hypothetical protein
MPTRWFSRPGRSVGNVSFARTCTGVMSGRPMELPPDARRRATCRGCRGTSRRGAFGRWYGAERRRLARRRGAQEARSTGRPSRASRTGYRFTTLGVPVECRHRDDAPGTSLQRPGSGLGGGASEDALRRARPRRVRGIRPPDRRSATQGWSRRDRTTRSAEARPRAMIGHLRTIPRAGNASSIARGVGPDAGGDLVPVRRPPARKEPGESATDERLRSRTPPRPWPCARPRSGSRWCSAV